VGDGVKKRLELCGVEFECVTFVVGLVANRRI